MKRIAFIFVACLPLCAFGADCDALCKKYSSPNPASKTMAQLERWVKNRVDNPKDAAVLKHQTKQAMLERGLYEKVFVSLYVELAAFCS